MNKKWSSIARRSRTMVTPDDTACCFAQTCGAGAYETQGEIASFAMKHIGNFFNAEMANLALSLIGANDSTYSCHGPHCGGWHDRLCGDDWPETGSTMVGLVRMSNVASLIHRVIEDGVPGAYAELGVWRGGTCMFAEQAFRFDKKRDQNERIIHVFDAFDKLPGYGKNQDYLENSEASVRDLFAKMGALSPSVQFHVGMFKDTTKEYRATHQLGNTRIAILRIDGNFYDSYSDALYNMYEYVPIGGYVIFDDVMSHKAVMQCWKDFKAEQNIPEELVQIDKHSAFFQKTKDTIIDQSKKHAAVDANK